MFINVTYNWLHSLSSHSKSVRSSHQT